MIDAAGHVAGAYAPAVDLGPLGRVPVQAPALLLDGLALGYYAAVARTLDLDGSRAKRSAFLGRFWRLQAGCLALAFYERRAPQTGASDFKTVENSFTIIILPTAATRESGLEPGTPASGPSSGPRPDPLALRREGRPRSDALARRVEEALSVAGRPLLHEWGLDGCADVVAQDGAQPERRGARQEARHDDEADQVVVVLPLGPLLARVLGPLVREEEDARDDAEAERADDVEDPLLAALLRQQRAGPAERAHGDEEEAEEEDAQADAEDALLAGAPQALLLGRRAARAEEDGAGPAPAEAHGRGAGGPDGAAWAFSRHSGG